MVPESDTGQFDTGQLDTGRFGPSAPGTGRFDAGRLDTGQLDTGQLPTGRFDTAPPGTGRPGRGRPGPGRPDAGPYAARPGRPDPGLLDTGRFGAPGAGTGSFDPSAPPGPPGVRVLDQQFTAPPGAPGRHAPGADVEGDGDEDGDEAESRRRRGRRRRARPAERPGRPAPAATPGPRPELPRVDAFDGVRALALLAVLAFHQGFSFASGGFLGLSTFFTLSGFLVATVAVAEWSQNGTLVLSRLWEHRARRIVPALVFTVAVVVVLQTVPRVGAGPGFRVDVLAALAQGLNWRFVLDGGGFDTVLTDPSPVQHLWSMSALVQMTVVLPLAFVGLMRLAGTRWRLVGAAFALLAAASFAVAGVAADRAGNDGLAYYGTHTRAGELLVGVVLAYVVLSPRVRRVVDSPRGLATVRYGALAALAGLAWLWYSTGLYSSNLFAGVTALNAALTAVVLFAVTLPGPAADVLGSLPLRTVGRLSYAAYLLHWPLFLLVDEDRIGLDGPLLFAVRLAATLGAAALVHYAIEAPFLRRLSLPPLRLAVALGAALAVVAAAAVVLPEQPPAGVTLAVDDGSGPGDLDVVVPSGDEVASIALVGGSLAGSLPAGFEAWNGEHAGQQVRLHTHIATDCPLSGPGPVRLAGETIGEDTDCLGFGPRLPGLLDAADADVMVVVPGVGDLGTRQIGREWLHVGDPVFDEYLYERLDELASTLEEAGVPVVWTTVPHVRLAPAGEGAWTEVPDNQPQRVDRLNELIRDVAARHDDTTVADLGAWAQRLPRGEFGIAHRVEGRDLTEDGAKRAVAWLMPELFALLGVEEEAAAQPPAEEPVPPATPAEGEGDPAATDPAATDPAAG